MEKVVIVEYETSLGLETLEFKNGDNIFSDVNENRGVIYIEERQEREKGQFFNKELAIISLDSFVSFLRKEK